jgi:hypothetical protein
MGDDVKRPRAQMTPPELVGFLNRVLQLGPGIHTVTVIKLQAGKDGLVGWSVETAKLERPTPPRAGDDSGRGDLKSPSL